MKRLFHCAAAIIILLSFSCSKPGPGSPPRELLQTWTLYPDCPNNSISFRGNGSYEWVECFTDENGGEKITRWTGKYAYVSDKEIRVTHKNGTLDMYSIDSVDGKKVLKHGGFVFHPAR